MACPSSPARPRHPYQSIGGKKPPPLPERQLILTCPPRHVHQRPLPYRPQTPDPLHYGTPRAGTRPLPSQPRNITSWAWRSAREWSWRRTGAAYGRRAAQRGLGTRFTFTIPAVEEAGRAGTLPPRPNLHPLPAGVSGRGLRAHCDGRPGGGGPPHGGAEAPPGAARPDAAGRRRN